MIKKILIIILLFSQTALYMILPFVEQYNNYQEEQKLSCKIKKQEKLVKADPVAQALANLRNSSDATRTTAATELGFIGFGRVDVIEALKVSTWKDPSKWVRRAAVKSMYKLAGKGAIPTLRNALKDKDPYVVHSAQRALVMLR